MEADAGPASTADDVRTPNTLFNALVGAAVSVVLGFVPFSPVVGGGVAGYLEGGDAGDAARVGVLSGLLAAIPLALVVGLVAAAFVIVPEGSAPNLALGFVALVLVVSTYTAGSSVLGAVLGVYLKNAL